MAVTVASVPSSAGSPRQTVTVSGLTVGTDATFTVERNWFGQQAPVRGAVGVPVLGASATVVDYEAPLGTNTTYTVTVYDSAGAVTGQALSAGQSILGQQPWISDPLAPANSEPVEFGEAFGTLVYTRAGDVLQPIGAALPVASVGTRMAAGSIPLDLLCTSSTEVSAVLGVLLAADPVCLRVPYDDTRYQILPPLCYITADTITRQTLGVQGPAGWNRIVWTGQLVRPPTSTILVPTRTYADVPGEASTYGGLPGLYPTYTALLLGG